MTMPTDFAQTVLPELERLWDTPVEMSEGQIILGHQLYAGTTGAKPSSAARLRVGDHQRWIPAPLPSDEDGPASIFLHGGHRYVLPILRLFHRGESGSAVSYFPFADWIYDAITQWHLVVVDDKALSLMGYLQERQEANRTDVAVELGWVARVIYYAVHGSQFASREEIIKGVHWRLPARASWLRPTGATTFAQKVDRFQAVTAKQTDPGDVPSTQLKAKGYRTLDPGVDPVHTPESSSIRLTMRIGERVQIEDRHLIASDSELSLSPSTARLPFASFNDPRRLLMASNAQSHAIHVEGQESPLVQASPDGEDPPGVNLRVGYLAWQGWNHEDAWVLSESAAKKLKTSQVREHHLMIRAVELCPELKVGPGEEVKRGDLLMERRIAPCLLAPDLGQLARLAMKHGLDHEVTIEPEPEDVVTHDGEVLEVERWDLIDPSSFAEQFMDQKIDRENLNVLSGRYREIIRLRIRRQLPLQVGDKLANRHGHKGIVGKILPDEEMPRWRGKPLEALIDPISVLNRSNWGQIQESLAGAVAEESQTPVFSSQLSAEELMSRAQALGASPVGTWDIDPPPRGDWMTSPKEAGAGVQFVMRLPHHACDKIAPSLQGRRQRFGEMEHWALWAHGLGRQGWSEDRMTAGARRLQNLLAMAGVNLHVKSKQLVLRKLDLSKVPTHVRNPLHLYVTTPEENKRKEGESKREKGTTKPVEIPDPLRSLRDVYGDLQSDDPAHDALVFGEPIRDVKLPHSEEERGVAVHWLPLIPPRERQPHRQTGVEHPLTTQLRALVRWAYFRRHPDHQARGASHSAEVIEERLRSACEQVMRTAHDLAVGANATGLASSKMALLRRGVLGRWLPHSARASAAPAGTLGLELDEIGLPRSLAGVVLSDPPQERIWIKRDPVLHRWGLIPVRYRLIDEDVIRLPASLLGPMGADFDGDTIAVYGNLPGVEPEDVPEDLVMRLAWDELRERAAFVPGKQFIYGLHLLVGSEERLSELNQALVEVNAPEWTVDEPDVKTALEKWIEKAKDRDPEGNWWSLLEKRALDALAEDPGMGLGLHPWKMLTDVEMTLPVLKCGAAKKALYVTDNAATLAMGQRIYEGRSLETYQRQDLKKQDPIERVMVIAKSSVGQFGGALRRLIHSSESPLRPEQIRLCQSLTEQATQQALSVKGGEAPMEYGPYGKALVQLLNQGQTPPCPSDLSAVEKIWKEVTRGIAQPLDGWMEWLRQPWKLIAILERDGSLAIPLSDVRALPWLAEQLTS